MGTGDSLDGLAVEFVRLRRQEARVLAEVAALDRGGGSVSFGSVAKMVADVGRVGVGESRRLAERAAVLHGSIGVSGAPVRAVLPRAASAYAEGAIAGEHVDRIRGLAETLPVEVLAGESWSIAEACLADLARGVGPRGLTRPTRPIRALQARLDPDGQEPDETALAEPTRALRLTRRRPRFTPPEYRQQTSALREQPRQQGARPLDSAVPTER